MQVLGAPRDDLQRQVRVPVVACISTTPATAVRATALCQRGRHGPEAGGTAPAVDETTSPAADRTDACRDHEIGTHASRAWNTAVPVQKDEAHDVGRTGAAGGPSDQEPVMSKDKGGRAAKKPKAEKNIKVSGQTPPAGSGAVSASTAKGKK